MTTAKRIGGQSCTEHLLGLLNRRIAIVLCDGEVIEGTLVGIGTYELLIKQAECLQVLVFKAAIKYLHEIKSLAGDFERAKQNYQQAKANGADQVELERLAAIVVETNERLGPAVTDKTV